MQHDVQEFSRILQDKLEVKMKGTPAEGAIPRLFRGQMKNYLKCINVDFESSVIEDFYGRLTDHPLTNRHTAYHQRDQESQRFIPRLRICRDT